MRLATFLLPLLLVTFTAAGAVFEFDGTEWTPKPRRKALRIAADTTIFLIADSGTRFDQFQPILTALDPKSPPNLKLQLRDQPQSVLIDLAHPQPEVPETLVTVIVGPGGASLVGMTSATPSIETTSKLGADLEGIQAFLNDANELYKPKNAEAPVPPTAFMVRSNCSFGQFITVAQLLKHSGLGPAVIAINDELSDPDVNVHVPQATSSTKAGDTQGGIVIHLDAEGTASREDRSPLASDEDIAAYIRSRKAEIEKTGGSPRIQLRGDSGSLFKSSLRIIRIAAKEGVAHVIFAALLPHAAEEGLKRREHDLDMSLPRAKPDDGDAVPFPPLFVRINAAGAIFVNSGPAEEAHDTDPKLRDLPLFSNRIQHFAESARAVEQEPLVQLHVDPATPQQRVIDVLNALAGAKIGNVTFTDLVGDE